LICIVVVLGFDLYNHFLKQEETNSAITEETKETIINIARAHLQKYVGKRFNISNDNVEVVEENAKRINTGRIGINTVISQFM